MVKPAKPKPKPSEKGKGNAAPAPPPPSASSLTPGSAKWKKFKKKATAKAGPEKAAEAAAAAAATDRPSSSGSALKPPVDAARSNGVAERNGNKKKRRRERASTTAAKGERRVLEDKAKGKAAEEVAEKSSGFIFMCSGKTKPECYRHRVFGLPKGKIEVVEKIRPGTKLFLYDFDLKLLYGVYKASSRGRLDLAPEAFRGMFPAQVKFRIDKDCLPLPESSFKHAIKENYNSKGKFTPELNSKQVRRLLALFNPASLPLQPVAQQYVEERRPSRYDKERRPPHRVEKRHPPHYVEERRQSHHVEERRPSHYERRPPHYVEERRPPHYVEERRPQPTIHLPPLENSYRPGHLVHVAPPIESLHSHSLAPVQDDRHVYYRHVPPMPEHQLLPAIAPPSDDLYYHPPRSDTYQVDPMQERVARRIIPEVNLTDALARDYRALPGPDGAIPVRAGRVEELYISDQLATRAAGVPHRATYLTAAYEDPSRVYAEALQRPSTRVNIPGVPVSSLYSFAGAAPAYQ